MPSYKNKEARQAYLKAYRKEHYKKNKEKYLKSHQVTWRRTREILAKLREVPCTDCQVEYPYYVMQFDHIGIEPKSGNVMWIARTKGRKAALEEVKKCEIVCANCHATRTYKRAISLGSLNGQSMGFVNPRLGDHTSSQAH